MALLEQFRLRLRSLFRKPRVESELDEELQYHLDRQIAEFEKGGLSHADARRAALRTVGGVAQIKEECRQARG
ncbi:MAG: permease prefix domain 1-containing protein, partial [Bryobacteraceae bacterium]